MSELPNLELEKIEQAARQAIEAGSDIRNQIRRVTLEALKAGHLQAERIKGVVKAVGEGAMSAVESNVEASKDTLAEAFSGIDDALAAAAQATQLTLEEARQRVQHFTDQDLAKAKADLMALESMFLSTLGELAARSTDTAKQILTDLRNHAQASGTAVGKQITSAVSDAAGKLTDVGKTQIDHAVDAAFSGGAHLAQVASGVLADLAENLSGTKPEKK